MTEVTEDILTWAFMVIGLSCIGVVGWLIFSWLRDKIRIVKQDRRNRRG
ncbi:hypothetical protein LCGC14_1817730 [marine sediment metagenome]|uniref:Uncharacterized protein n=1 Tax=marine sediment metagenome TaxID=412755 RepID=A0A0F9IZL7_9ZZZZ